MSIMFTCPYCSKKAVPPPEKRSFYQTCTNCGFRPRVVRVHVGRDGDVLYKYVSTAKAKKHPDDLRKRRKCSVSNRELELLRKRGFPTVQKAIDFFLTLDASSN